MALRCPICVDYREGGKPEYPEKTFEAQERSTAGILSHGTSPTSLGFSGERHNALTACATRVSVDICATPRVLLVCLSFLPAFSIFLACSSAAPIQHPLYIFQLLYLCQRVDTIKREMFSQKSVRRFVGDSSAFVMGAIFLASALNRGISPRY